MNEREKLPGRRPCVNSSFKFQGLMVDLQVGYYPDGRLGEVFMTTRRHGSMVDVLCRDTALLVSVALQYGVPVAEMRKSATVDDAGKPEGVLAALFNHMEKEGLFDGTNLIG